MVNGNGEGPELTSDFVKVIVRLTLDRSCEIPDNAFEVLVKAIRPEDAGTRRSGKDLAIALWKHWYLKKQDEEFWRRLRADVDQETVDMLMYFIAKTDTMKTQRL